MDWGWIIIMVLAILGAALIVGGFVAYQGSMGVGLRAFGAAGVAAEVVMWAVVLFTVPATSSTDGSPSPTVNVEEISE